MQIIWHGHSCFTVKTKGGTVVFDPYADNYVPGLSPLRLRADAVICSHDHRDHGAAELVTLTGAPYRAEIERFPAWHDEVFGAKRGANTITLIRDEGLRLAHLGDIGHIPEERISSALKGVDVLILPVGGYYTIDAGQAKQIVDMVQPRVVIPCHYRQGGVGYDVLAELPEFTELCDDVVRYPGSRIEVTAETPPQVAVLTL